MKRVDRLFSSLFKSIVMVILHHDPTIGDIVVVGKQETTVIIRITTPQGVKTRLAVEPKQDVLPTYFGDFIMSPEDISNINNYFKNL